MTLPKQSLPLPTCICGDPACKIPYGTCHCRCGLLTKLSNYENRTQFQFKGKPLRYIKGHQCKIRLRNDEFVPFRLSGVWCCLIPLTLGLCAKVDVSDYEWLMQWKWHAAFDKRSNRYYAMRSEMINGKAVTIRMHREILGLRWGDQRFADHVKNGDTLNNTRKNLRIATKSQNRTNSKMYTTNTSGYTGVTYFPTGKRHWRSQIVVHGKKTHLGLFHEKEEARDAYIESAKRLHGEFARLA